MSDESDAHRLAALHRLVDELPEEALDATLRVLENYAKWPPKGQADANRMQEQARERFIRRHEERARRTGTGFIAGIGGGSSFTPDGFGHSSTHGWEGHTSITVNVYFFRGHEMRMTEKLSLSADGRMLSFEIEATIPNSTPKRHEFKFELL